MFDELSLQDTKKEGIGITVRLNQTTKTNHPTDFRGWITNYGSLFGRRVRGLNPYL